VTDGLGLGRGGGRGARRRWWRAWAAGWSWPAAVVQAVTPGGHDGKPRSGATIRTPQPHAPSPRLNGWLAGSRICHSSRGMETDDGAAGVLRARHWSGERLSDRAWGTSSSPRTTEIVAAAAAGRARRDRRDIGGGPGAVRAVAGVARLPGRAPGPDAAARSSSSPAERGPGYRGFTPRSATCGELRPARRPRWTRGLAARAASTTSLDRAERVAALQEWRADRPARGGAVFAAAISRWAARIDGMLRERIYLKYPEVTGPDRRGGPHRDAAAAGRGGVHRVSATGPGNCGRNSRTPGLGGSRTWSASRDRRSSSATWMRGLAGSGVSGSVALEVARAVERVPRTGRPSGRTSSPPESALSSLE